MEGRAEVQEEEWMERREEIEKSGCKERKRD